MKFVKYLVLILALAIASLGQVANPVLPTSAPVYPTYASVRVPDFAVLTLTYQLGASFFGGSYQEVADVGDLVSTPEQAAALLKTFQTLGYKWTLNSLTGSVLTLEYPDSRREFQFWSGPTYCGNVQQYLIASYVNGVGAPGTWSKGPFGPIWTPTKVK